METNRETNRGLHIPERLKNPKVLTATTFSRVSSARRTNFPFRENLDLGELLETERSRGAREGPKNRTVMKARISSEPGLEDMDQETSIMRRRI
jgi:hypothetical protein